MRKEQVIEETNILINEIKEINDKISNPEHDLKIDDLIDCVKKMEKIIDNVREYISINESEKSK